MHSQHKKMAKIISMWKRFRQPLVAAFASLAAHPNT
jgi:hypothetical protein